jgi:hypothetical protein
MGSAPSIVIGADGLPLIAYNPAPDPSHGTLKVAHCSNLACTSWSSAIVDNASGNVGQYPSVTIGPDGLGLIAYMDTNGNAGRVAHCTNVVCSSVTTSTFLTGGTPSYESLTIGADGLGLMSYAFSGLRVAHCSNTGCTAVSTTVVDSASTSGTYSSITTGSDGFGLIAYYDSAGGNLDVAHCTDATCSSFTTGAVDTANDVGRGASITVGDDGLGLVSYYDATNHVLKVAHCVNVACSSVATSTVDAGPDDVGSYTAITIGPDGLGLIAYYDATTQKLKIAHCSDTACTSATTQVIAPTESVDGRGPSLTIGADGLGVIAYRDGASGVDTVHLSNPLGIPYFRRR